jgi:hypothetical protein
VEWSGLIAQVRDKPKEFQFVCGFLFVFQLAIPIFPHLQACMASVNLSAQAYWTPDPTFTGYLNYGAGISEVSLRTKLPKQANAFQVKLHRFTSAKCWHNVAISIAGGN